MVALWLVLPTPLPDFHAAIQFVLLDASFSTLELAVYLMFAFMTFPETPEPASSSTLMELSKFGITWPLPERGEIVTLPEPSVYITNIVAPVIPEPIPMATQV